MFLWRNKLFHTRDLDRSGNSFHSLFSTFMSGDWPWVPKTQNSSLRTLLLWRNTLSFRFWSGLKSRAKPHDSSVTLVAALTCIENSYFCTNTYLRGGGSKLYYIIFHLLFVIVAIGGRQKKHGRSKIINF